MKLVTLLKPLVALSAAAAASGGLAADPRVDIKTNVGTIRIELYPAKAPQTVENFLRYVKDGHFDGTVFHRVIAGFMIQGGGFDRSLRQKATRDPIRNEAEIGVKAGLKNDLGTLAMARTRDPHSATAQFFINVADNAFLNWGDARGDGNGYAAFAKVISGLDVVMQISKVETGPSGIFPRDVPRDAVVIEKMTLVADKK
ncbi:MAG: peptidyl-prolyl cis-trans isomerase [Betaproteobacteria bacterium]|nr:MAG: peptidyl-prolyl cis-trans isomerase [Betaproteobacteria bacterium]